MGCVSSSAPSPRRSRRVRLAAALAVLLALVGYVAAQYATGGKSGRRCAVTADGQRYELTPEQAGNAAVISAVGTTRGLPERAVAIALATALQESGLRNIEHGDRDSLGLFQQRPSQGWGTQRQIMDPVFSAGKFYEHLAEVPGYSRLPLTVAAQRVQRSGFPQAYAKHEPDATLLAAALTGRPDTSLTCETLGDATAGDPARVRSELARSFGAGVLAEPRRGASGAPAGGRITLPVTGEDAERRGRQLARWAVANAEGLHLSEVSFGNRTWRAAQSSRGWVEGPDKGPGVRLEVAR
ncbi:hypothetical protein ABT160_06635 [Streptomyces sp. NPDC001941]|uniref:hypothetical protein n=1 Tax=Streptomyces sp. NPDC001941 TaxID=3154659 RepID=UPI00332E1E70